jgi:hypothetical protein
MRTNKLFRLVLALVAALAVGGPGLVLAGDGPPDYAPRVLQVIGPSSVATGSLDNEYSARVTFTNGEVFTFTGAPVTATVTAGSISDGFLYDAPTTAGRVAIRMSYSNQGVTVTGVRIVNVVGP